MKTLLLLMTFLLIQTSLFSQDTYPKKLVIGGDTVVAITQEQSREMTKAFIELNYLGEMVDSLEQKVIYLQSNRVNDSTIIGNLGQQIVSLNEINANCELEKERLLDDLSKTDKELVKEQSKNKLQNIGLGLLAALAIILSITGSK